MMRPILAIGAVASLALWAGTAPAQEPLPPSSGDHHPEAEAESQAPGDRLDRLLETLADEEASDPEHLVEEIARLWSTSGSDSMDLLLRRGREAMDDEAFDKALTHLDALTELDPEFAEGWNARATAHFLDDEFYAAVADLSRVLALEPRHFGALTGLGVILEQTGDAAGALRAFRAALALNPHLDNAREAAERLAPEVDGRDI